MDTLVILAISVIIIGSLLLAGLAIWLAVDRSRHVAAGRSQASRQGGNPAAKPAPPISGAPPVGQPARPAPPPAPPTPAEPHTPAQPKGAAGPASANPAPGAASSGEYPAAALYDQTILPPPPKRRTRSEP